MFATFALFAACGFFCGTTQSLADAIEKEGVSEHHLEIPAMPTKEIAPGVHMPVLNIGTWVGGSLKPESGKVITSNWLSLGYRGIDTAFIYGDEGQIAKAIKTAGVDRKDLFITSKIPSCEPISAAVAAERNLAQLKTDYIDLLLVHFPIGLPGGCVATWKVLEGLVRKGKVRAIGVSNFKRGDLRGILASATIRPAVNQIGYSVFQHNDDTIKFCHEQNITVEAYSPLAGAHGSIRTIGKDPTIKAIAQAHGVSPYQVALKWIIQRGDVAAFLSGNKDHQASDADIFKFTLQDNEMDKLSKLKVASDSTIVI